MYDGTCMEIGLLNPKADDYLYREY
jgi:hypothetical protein